MSNSNISQSILYVPGTQNIINSFDFPNNSNRWALLLFPVYYKGHSAKRMLIFPASHKW